MPDPTPEAEASYPRERASADPRPNDRESETHVAVAVRDSPLEIEDPRALLEGLFAHSPVPQVLLEAKGGHTYPNRACQAMFEADVLTGYDVLDVRGGRVDLLRIVARAFGGESVETGPAWYVPKAPAHGSSSRRRAAACACFPVLGPRGDVTHVALAFRDMTDELLHRERAAAEHDELKAAIKHREQLAQALRESDERLRRTLEAAEVGTWEWNIPQNRVHWSSNIEVIFGIPPGSFAGTYEAWSAFVHPDDRALVAQRIRATLSHGEPYAIECRFVRPDGSVRWQSARGYLVSDEAGRPLLLRGTVVDVTERRLSEDARRMQAEVLENMNEGVVISDEQGVIVYTTPAQDRMFGYARGELLGKPVGLLNRYPPDENQRIVAAVIEQLQRCGEWTGEFANQRKDGSAFTTRARITRLEIEGRPYWVSVQEDVTERRAAQHKLHESEARYRTFVGQSTEGIWRFELEEPIRVDLPFEEQLEQFLRYGFLAECNDAMARMYGYANADMMIGRRLGELLVPTEPRNAAYLRAFVDNGYRLNQTESEERDRDGKRRVFDNSLVGFVEDGILVRVWGTQRDITAQVEAREAAQAANRAKDEFLAMLGHELRNPMAPLLTAIDLMKLRAPHVFERERSVIERQVKHVVRLVDDLLDISRITRGKISIERQRVDLARAINGAIELASPLIEQHAHHLSVHLCDGMFVQGDALRLSQVFSNLLNNAAKYTSPGGTITIVAERSEGQVCVRVRDTGIGIRPEILPNIFDLFVQEQQAIDRSEGGLGLGLAIVRALVALHGGEVTAFSEGRGRGSEFSVTFPLAGEPVEVTGVHSEAHLPLPALARRVLLVDDNVEAALLLAEVLRSEGHMVRVAHDGPAALKLLEDFTPDIALLDIGLPVMDGYELARRIRSDAKLRAVHLIAVTGYGDLKARTAARNAGFDQHLVKPVDLASLDGVLASIERHA